MVVNTQFHKFDGRRVVKRLQKGSRTYARRSHVCYTKISGVVCVVVSPGGDMIRVRTRNKMRTVLRNLLDVVPSQKV